MTIFRFQPRRGTAAEAAENNGVLLMGEKGFETDTGRWKTGDGATHWNDLPYDDEIAAPATTAVVNASIALLNRQTITSLRASASAPVAGFVEVSGYYVPGDGGGGVFWYDASDTTSPHNGGTILTSTAGLTGRWKRVYSGECNARWFGVHPGQTDNTAALQAAVDWVSDDQTRNPNGGFGAGVVFIPAGYYRFTFDQGTSGLSTITIDSNHVTIRGEGSGTQLTVRSHAAPSQLNYFFTFSAAFKAHGGGVKDIAFLGNSMLKWCIYLNTWHAAEFENIKAYDVHSGIIDGESTLAMCGENVLVRHCDYIATSSGSTACLTQYGVRFRSTAVGSWSDSRIQDCVFVGIWDYGIVLDGVIRFTCTNNDVSQNFSSSNTIDGSAKSDVKGAYKITHTVSGAWSTANGQHVIDCGYDESHSGTETTTNNAAVLIEAPASGGGYNRYNRISNINTSWNTTAAPALLRITNDNTVGRVNHNTFIGNRRPLNFGVTGIVNDQIYIGPGVEDTFLWLTSQQGNVAGVGVSNQGTRTYINGTRTSTFTGSAAFPNNRRGSAETDVGEILVDALTGRVIWQDQDNDSHVISRIPGVDMVSSFGAQRIQQLATPSAPTVAPANSGSTTWSYYVVAIDKDGNKTPPSPVGSTTLGTASLSATNYNVVQWKPVEGAVKYDLLRGGTTTSIATNLVATHFYDTGASTSAYTASGSNPPGTLTVDGKTTAAGGVDVLQNSSLAIYNTSDILTNYERVRQYYTGNVFILGSENGGTGSMRALRLSAAGFLQLYGSAGGPTVGSIQAFLSSSVNTATVFGVNGTLSASTGLQYGESISPSVAQSGTAGYTMLLVNVTETSTGSGAKLLADFQVGGTSKAKIDSAGTVTVQAIDVGSTDTTITRYAAGQLAVEGVPLASDRATKNTQTGTTYTLALTDTSKVVEMNNASANTLTVPPNGSVAFDNDVVIEVHQYGAGQTTIAAGAGVTIRSPGGKLKLGAQYSSATLRKRATDEWVLSGDLVA